MLNRFVQTTTKTLHRCSSSARDGFYRSSNWTKAAEKFNDFTTAYPKDKDLDAALYWYG